MKWGPTNLVGLARSAFDNQKGQCCQTQYYSYLDKQAIVDDIVEQKRVNPNVRINFVGHSRGGAMANEIVVNILSKANILANIVVFLDPVKANPSDSFIRPKSKRSVNANQYICVFAKPIKRDPTDYVAIVGGQYGDKLQSCCDYFYVADANHGEVMKMLKSELPGAQISAWDILLNESRTV